MGESLLHPLNHCLATFQPKFCLISHLNVSLLCKSAIPRFTCSVRKQLSSCVPRSITHAYFGSGRRDLYKRIPLSFASVAMLVPLLIQLQSRARCQFTNMTEKSTTRIKTHTQLSTAHSYLSFCTPHTTRARFQVHSTLKPELPYTIATTSSLSVKTSLNKTDV